MHVLIVTSLFAMCSTNTNKRCAALQLQQCTRDNIIAPPVDR